MPILEPVLVTPTYGVPLGQLTGQPGQYLSFLATGVADRTVAGQEAQDAVRALIGPLREDESKQVRPLWLTDWVDRRPIDLPFAPATRPVGLVERKAG